MELTMCMKAPAHDPGDLWQSTKVLAICLLFALDDDKFCILNLSPTFPAETECEQKGKEKL